MMERMGFLSKEKRSLLSVKTIHSLCFHHSQSSRARCLTPYLFERGYELFNLRFSENLRRTSWKSYCDEHDPFVFNAETDDDVAYGEVQRLRAAGLKATDTTFSGYLADRVAYIFSVLQDAFDHGLWDFTSLLEHAVESGMSFGADYVSIDEINDLNTLEWKICDRVFGEKIVFCGDLNQSIYEFAGVDPGYVNKIAFDAIEYKTITHRVPEKIATYAKNILGRATRVYGRPMEPKQDGGEIEWNNSFIDVCKKSQGHMTLVLGRTNAIVDKARAIALEYGCNVANESNELFRLIQEKPRMFCFRDGGAFWNLPAITYFKRGMKRVLMQSTGSDDEITWEKFYEGYGTRELRDLLEGKRSYVDVKKYGMIDVNKPSMVFSTIHKAKGLEEDHVVILKDTTKRIQDTDNEIRLAYVAATRAKRKVTVSELDGNVKSVLYG